MALITSTVRPLIAKYQNYAPLSQDEVQVLEGAFASTRTVELGADMAVAGTSPDYSTLLVSGFAGRYNITKQGVRQITAIHVPGDFVDLHCFLLKPMDHSIVALTTCEIAMMPHRIVGEIFDTQPKIARLFWLNTLIDGATHRKWSVALGSLQAHQHLAHFICELYLRMEQIGRTQDGSFHIPITQLVLGECLGLSSVHTNRTVQKLRSEKLIRWERDLITIIDWDRLVEVAEFDPTYLRIPKSRIAVDA